MKRRVVHAPFYNQTVYLSIDVPVIRKAPLPERRSAKNRRTGFVASCGETWGQSL
jgi:hypothetical protein